MITTHNTDEPIQFSDFALRRILEDVQGPAHNPDDRCCTCATCVAQLEAELDEMAVRQHGAKLLQKAADFDPASGEFTVMDSRAATLITFTPVELLLFVSQILKHESTWYPKALEQLGYQTPDVS